jgi:xanthine dehydrogenase accessory factor
MHSYDLPVLEAILSGDAVLCTLISVEGGFSRSVGAQIAITKDGRCIGDMTGGCLESALINDAAEVRATGKNRIVRYGKGSSYIDIQLPCGGGVELYVDAKPDVEIARASILSLKSRQSADYAFRVGETSAWKVGKGPHSTGSQYFQKDCHPNARLLIFGNGPEVQTLSGIAQTTGCEIDVMTPKGGGGVPGKEVFLGQSPGGLTVDPWTAIILLFHDHEWEDAILNWALSSDAFYIGALGGQKAVQRRNAALAQAGLSNEAIKRVHGPIGLIPFARDAKMLAISILAEVAQCYGQKTGRLEA